jgi:23S rRNA pseudouridine2605 synthase/23S rRNA pseudouridine2604 synthase
MTNEKNRENEKGMRIQKYLSEQGIASRRKSEEWIEMGLVYLNGEPVTEPGIRFDPSKDKVTLDPAIRQTEKYYYYLYNKPAGIVTVNAQPGEVEIRDALKLPKGVVPVGRLDKESSGLLMLTNDGVVARRLMEPSFEHEKEYEVTFGEPFTEEASQKIQKGMYLFGKKTKPIRIKRINKYTVRMILQEGKNRQIRRMCEMTGYRVKKLKRVRILNFWLDNLPKGRTHELSKAEVLKLYSAIGLDGNRTVLHESRKPRHEKRIKKDS